MKAKEMRKLALMGMAAGLISMGDAGLQANLDTNAIDLDYVLAKPSCKAHGGCGGLTAMRDAGNSAEDEENLEEETDTEDDFDELGVDQPV